MNSQNTYVPDSPIGSISDHPDFAIQINEPYDIRNDDINEDIFVSYDVYETERPISSSDDTVTLSFDGEPSSNRRDALTRLTASQNSVIKNKEHNSLSNNVFNQQNSFISNINNKLLSSSFYENKSTIDKVPLATESIRIDKTDSMLFTTPTSRNNSNNIGISEEDLLFDSLPSKDTTMDFSPIESKFRSTLENALLISNSPISSQSNSDSETEPDEPMRYMINEQVENAFANRKMRFKKISYDEIERSLSKYYDKNNKYSNEVDILITFIRGQKHLYNQSDLIIQTKLYAITITALAITSVITVITPFIQQYWWKTIFIMSGNALTTILITILKYMRFESASNTFTLLSNHYEHYEKSLQLTTNKLVFVTDEAEQNKLVLEKIREIEFKMSETNELCPVIIPSEVQTTFPIIYQTNIFTLIKKMDVHRKTLIIQLKNIKNEIRYILFKWNMALPYQSGQDIRDSITDKSENVNSQILREKVRVLFLMEQKERIKKELVEYRDNYSQIDELFMKEIKYAELNRNCWRWFWCNPKKIQYDNFTNPIIKEHLELILGN